MGQHIFRSLFKDKTEFVRNLPSGSILTAWGVMICATSLVWAQREWGVIKAAPFTLTLQNLVRTENNAAGCRLKILKGRDYADKAVVSENQLRLKGPAPSLKSLHAGSEERFFIRGEWLWIKSSDESIPIKNGQQYAVRVPVHIADALACSIYAGFVATIALMAWFYAAQLKAEFRSTNPASPIESSDPDVRLPNTAVVRPATIQSERVAFLDGIRGWASIMVLLNHIIRGLALENLTPAFRHWLLAVPMDGNLAVAIFFVLSGFALSIKYFQIGNRKILTVLALRRYPRLALPIFCSCVPAYFLLRYELFYNHEAARMLGGFEWLDQLYQFKADSIGLIKSSLFDVFFAFNPARSYNVVLWTMPIEFFGSMAVFAVAAVFGHLRFRLLLVLAMALVALLLDSWYLAFLLGMIIAMYHCRPVSRRLLAQMVCLPAIAWMLFYSTATSGLVTWQGPQRSIIVTTLTGTFFVFSVVCSNALRSFFSNRFSTYLGSISFPLYLVHMPLLCSWECWIWTRLPQWGASPASAPWITVASTAIISLLVAHLFRNVEALAISAARKVSSALGRERNPQQVGQ